MVEVHQDIELDRMRRMDADNNEMHQQETVVEIEQVSLPPTDRGRDAWLVPAGCSLIQIPVWGM